MLTYRDITVTVDGKPITDYISFIWTDRYNTCGDFELEVPFTAQNNAFYKADQLVRCNLSSNTMIIETIKISVSAENGERMLLTGRDYSSVLDRRVVAFTQIYDNNFFPGKGKFMAAFGEIFSSCFGSGRIQALTTSTPDPNRKDYKDAMIYDRRRIMSMSVSKGNDPYGHINDANINIDATGKTVLELLEEHCQAKDFGFKTSGGTCTIYDGRHVGTVFSMAKGNLVSADYSASKEKYKNAAYIQGDEYQANQNKVEVDGEIIIVDELEPGTAVLLSPSQTGEDPIYYRAQVNSENVSGLNRREMYINSSKNLGQNSNAKYVARLEAEGRLELLKNHRWETQASCEVMHDPNVIYGKDFNLGDIVTVALNTTYNFKDKTGMKQSVKSIQMRINEFTISHSDAGLDLYPTLVAYDAEKYAQSNVIDSGFDPSETEENGYPSEYGKYSRVTFDFNTGHMSENSTGIIWTVPNTVDLNNKRLINGKYEPNEWYVLPEGLPEGKIDTSKITGKFSFQQFGDFVTGPGVEPVKEHYIFQGWYDKATGRKFEDHVPGDDSTGYLIQTNDITFIAKWEIERYDITFDHGDGGRFTTTSGLNESGQIVVNLPWGSYPSPPGVIPEPGYHAANPQWNPEIQLVENSATYTAQWEQEEKSEQEQVDPEDADYTNEDLPTDGLEDDEESSTEKTEGKETPDLGLIHFRSLGSRIGDQFEIRNNALVRSNEKDQAYEWVYTRELNNGFKFQAHWFDPRFVQASGGTAANEFSRVQNNRSFGISITNGNRVIGLWRWQTSITGYAGIPELAFTTVPTYIPYYDYSTLLDGYNRGDIQYGLLHLAPVFVPFKYYKKIGNFYWMLCVPPLDWISNWQSYYYLRKAGHYVGFTCQFYDDSGHRIDTNWIRNDPDGQGKVEVEVNGHKYSANTQLSYGTYYLYSSSSGRYYGVRGPNTIYSPNSYYMRSLSSYVDWVDLGGIWETSGWLWKKIPIERWSATEFADISSVGAAEGYSGPLAIPMNLSGESGGGDSYGRQWYGYYAPYTRSAGMIYGPGFPGYENYSIASLDWPVGERKIAENAGDGTFDILFKQSGSFGLTARIIQQINNVISKSKSLSYFTYRIWLPAMAKIKDTTWYVSSDGQNWHVISWAHGNSVKIQTTDKTAAEQQAAGLTGADAIVGTDGSYYKSEVRYTDEDGNEFLQTSDVGQLRIDDTDISGAGIEMGDLMNPDGTTKGIDIKTETDMSKITDGMKLSDLTSDDKLDIENMFSSGSTADEIAASTGIPKALVDLFIKSIN